MKSYITIKLFIIIGRVCVPIIPEECENFNPMTVPTISSLYIEIDDYNKIHEKKIGERNLYGNYKKKKCCTIFKLSNNKFLFIL